MRFVFVGGVKSFLLAAEHASDVELPLEIETLNVGEATNEGVGHFVPHAVDDSKFVDEFCAEILESLLGSTRLLLFERELVGVLGVGWTFAHARQLTLECMSRM